MCCGRCLPFRNKTSEAQENNDGKIKKPGWHPIVGVFDEATEESKYRISGSPTHQCPITVESAKLISQETDILMSVPHSQVFLGNGAKIFRWYHRASPQSEKSVLDFLAGQRSTKINLHSSSTASSLHVYFSKNWFLVGKETCPSPWVCCRPKTGGPGAIQVRDSSGTSERQGQVCVSLLPEQSWSPRLDQDQTPILQGTGHAASKHTHCNVVWISLSF